MKNWKKALGVPLLSAGLVVSAFGPAAFAADQPEKIKSPEISGHYISGPFDIGVANDEKLLRSLIEQGMIDGNASRAEQEKALKEYLGKRAEKARERAKKDSKGKKSFKTINRGGNGFDKHDRLHKDAFVEGNGKKLGLTKKTDIDSIDREGWNGKVREDKILVLLIDYPDLPYTEIDRDNPNITLSLPKYDKEHYQKMLFGENGYIGPKGNQLISVKQFYEQQSGGSYTVSGHVAGWYTAEHPAAYYGGNLCVEEDAEVPIDGECTGSDARPRQLIYEALVQAAQDPNVDLNDYDQEDPNDWDGDGNTREPDGVIDHLMVIHSGIGEEAGGGNLAGNAIWSHSWSFPGLTIIPGTHSDATKARFGVDALTGYAYTVEPEDGAAGVFAHEYGHNLGLPDEYDTIYSANSVGATVEYWSIMAAGSWAGKIPGTEPTGFSPYDKEYLQSTMPELNWMKGIELDYNEIDQDGVVVKLDEASVKGANADAVRINLPDKETVVNHPTSGEYEYFSGSGNLLSHSMVTTVDLTNATSAKLTFNTWYSIENQFDYASVEVKSGDSWVAIPGNITTDENPNNAEIFPGYGITGNSNGWAEAAFDLSEYAGQQVKLRFHYATDPFVAQPGFYVDDVRVIADGQTVLSDNAGSENSTFTLNGFKRDRGIKYTTQYYLLEWRNYAAADKALAHLRRGDSLMTYDPGLVVWYVDNKYDNNWVGQHPGDGFLGVVDAHQDLAYWSDGLVASTRYQIQDAAFSINKTDNMFLDYRDLLGLTLREKKQNAVPLFDDSRDYSNEPLIFAGRNVPDFGLKIRVVGQADDMSVGAVRIYK